MPAYYRSTLAEFLSDDLDRVLGVIVAKSAESGFIDLKQRQTKAWQIQLEVLRETVAHLAQQYSDAVGWGVLIEYPIPRRQKRIDAVLLVRDVILALEFKTGEQEHQKSTARQVEDYSLDLRDFHEESHGRIIVPIAVTTRANSSLPELGLPSIDQVKHVVKACETDLSEKVRWCVETYSNPGTQLDTSRWDNSVYRPVPTIIEAAEALYAGHDVREIARSHADARNLGDTSERLVHLIQQAQQNRRKILCIVTGVPGAGKTLAGLNVVHDPRIRSVAQGAGVFLSGNGPLVHIVSAAIARDFKKKQKAGDAERTVSTFIQNVHAFIKDSLNRAVAPVEHLVVFDEAQRAWDAAQSAKKNDRNESEPELMLSIMDRHDDWSVIIALVGGGQEINTGEAGLGEWGRAVLKRFTHWEVAASPQAMSSVSSDEMQRLFPNGHHGSIVVHEEPALHLNVSLRSYKAEAVSRWVDAVVDGNQLEAQEVIKHCSDFPMVITRDLETARAWLRQRTRGLRRCGLLASSGALRLRADGIELSSGFRRGDRQMYVNWFLTETSDLRASNQLEVAASEYECQGLELDLTCICWGGDLLYDQLAGWKKRKFVGAKWNTMKRARDHQYLLNTYRVLLTRAREGFIIWVPRGDANDPTRDPSGYNSTAEFLKRCGLPELD